jgi:cytochrome P450/NADPH-cytochrome P450 reductase
MTIRASGREVGPAVLYYGCHSKDSDALYDSELTTWESEGVVSVRCAFSRSPSDSNGCKYVQ